ncbi:MAG: AbrB/MazE/SpoVT family DNA-binding domain-containing protein [Candidatus Bathyarchaeia archaeon]
MSQTEELSYIFNRLVSLGKILMAEAGYVCSVNLDLVAKQVAIRVEGKTTAKKPPGVVTFTSSVRPVGRSPYSTTIPMNVAEALSLKTGDRLRWLPIDGAMYVTKT